MELSRFLPAAFEFYGQGEVRPDRTERAIEQGAATTKLFELLDQDKRILAFALQGELRAVLYLLVDAGLDAGFYDEIGNTLASRLATNIADENSLDVMITPPREITQALVHEQLRVTQNVEYAKYRHVTALSSVELDLFLLK